MIVEDARVELKPNVGNLRQISCNRQISASSEIYFYFPTIDDPVALPGKIISQIFSGIRHPEPIRNIPISKVKGGNQLSQEFANRPFC